LYICTRYPIPKIATQVSEKIKKLSFNVEYILKHKLIYQLMPESSKKHCPKSVQNRLLCTITSILLLLSPNNFTKDEKNS
jgi:hypothetical protein